MSLPTPAERLAASLDHPHIARIRALLLGGKDAYRHDRHVAQALVKTWPTACHSAMACRNFHRQTTDMLAATGINQFLDIGAGFEPIVHSVAQARNSTARTVYADIDPIVLAHGRALSSDDYTHWIDGDITNPDLALQRSAAAGLDLKQPIALSIVAAAEHIGSHSIAADPLRTLTAELAVGSALVMTQACFDGMSGQTHQAAAVYDHHGITFHPCTLDEFSHYFEGLTLDEPGVGPPHRWASTTCLTLSNSISDEDISCWGAVGRKASLH